MTEDDEFYKRIANTLDHSVEQLEQSTSEQLRVARERALSSAQQPSQQHYPQPLLRQWKPAIAMAAMLVLMIGFSWFTLKPASRTAPHPVFTESYLSVEPEMLADWEMLDVIGEEPDA